MTCLLAICYGNTQQQAQNGLASLRRRLATDGAVKCIRDAGISIVTGSDDDYDAARKVFSKETEAWPTAIVEPASTAQVAAAVKCANTWGVRVIPRCGGHGNEGESGATAAITIDLQSKMTKATLQADGFVVVQGGSTAGMAVNNLLQASNNSLAFPIGQRPVVGLSGFALVGGFGLSSRLGGLASDNVVAVKGVDHAGKVVEASANKNPDLLWALLGGGGGNLIIVTEWTLRTMNVSSGITVFTNIVPMVATHVQTYLNWTSNPTMNRRATIKCGTANTTHISVGGWFFGSVQQTLFFLQNSGLPKTGALAVSNFQMSHMSYFDALVNQIGWAAPQNANPLLYKYLDEMSFYKYKSMAVFNADVPEASLNALMAYAKVPGGVWEFDHFGGAIASVPAAATALPFRKATHMLVMRANSKNETIALNALKQASRLLDTLVTNTGRYLAYTGFIDTDVPGLVNMRSAFYGDSLTALQCANAKYDPRDKLYTPIMLGMPSSAQTGQAAPGVKAKSPCATLLGAKGKATAAWVKQLMAGGGTFGP
eukprot:CAMPEP_0202875900 /NCGR_PEP_ID=MMETSP1391-20130828/28114_1 /ASSEMBLY_ACC=CAM_ASM_000867 /TAXON_ID=1034604 /ORGANISM="Chlamydomonas leiostraca, Strain SAG 11-49" /LENGTH=540 /DNA_ID=CAMNT_0049557653 /DNA_START=70 /DNA_END=1692 /DNA_ORIENTATION=-